MADLVDHTSVIEKPGVIVGKGARTLTESEQVGVEDSGNDEAQEAERAHALPAQLGVIGAVTRLDELADVLEELAQFAVRGIDQRSKDDGAS